MERLLRCDCGYEVRADDEDELVARVRRHALEVHGMRFTRDEVLRLAARPGAGEATERPAENPRGGTT
jgi:uncharacterized protein DUF1059